MVHTDKQSKEVMEALFDWPAQYTEEDGSLSLRRIAYENWASRCHIAGRKDFYPVGATETASHFVF